LSDLMTAKELEALLRIDVKTIYGYVQRGLIPYVRIQSNVRFVRQEIDEWIRRQSYDPDGTREKRRETSRPRGPRTTHR
jgi:excisionase family DNA binding protein